MDQLGTPHLTRLWIAGRLLVKARHKKNLDLLWVFQRLNAIPCKKVYYVSSVYIQPLTTHWIHQYMDFPCCERGGYVCLKHYLIFFFHKTPLSPLHLMKLLHTTKMILHFVQKAHLTLLLSILYISSSVLQIKQIGDICLSSDHSII